MTYLTQNNFSSESKNNLVAIQDFLTQNQNSQEAMNFVQEALSALTNNQFSSFNQILILDSPENPFTDILDFLNCFDTTQPATLVVYSAEPEPGSGDTYKLTTNGTYVGHSFIRITQGNNTCTVGFYPESDYINPLNTSSQSVLGNDGGEFYTVSVKKSISSSQLQGIINLITNVQDSYDLNTYNCTDFAIQVGNIGGMSLPDCFGSWVGGAGSNPGTLGQYIRTHPSIGTVSTTPATATHSNKGC